MPVRPLPVTYHCPACHWSRTVAPHSDALIPGCDYFHTCPACCHRPFKTAQWRLLTNEAVDSLEQTIKRIDWYHARWEITLLFHTLKNCCHTERLQLDSLDKIERAIVLYPMLSMAHRLIFNSISINSLHLHDAKEALLWKTI